MQLQLPPEGVGQLAKGQLVAVTGALSSRSDTSSNLIRSTDTDLERNDIGGSFTSAEASQHQPSALARGHCSVAMLKA